MVQETVSTETLPDKVALQLMVWNVQHYSS